MFILCVDKSQAEKVRQKLSRVQIELPSEEEEEEEEDEDEEDEEFEKVKKVGTTSVSLLREIQVNKKSAGKN